MVDAARPQAAIRNGLRHLRGGGSLLLYPRGEIEPDPALYLDSALESLHEWSRSLTIFARHVPNLAVVPVAVGGVISRRALRHPLVRRYRDHDRRHFLAATFQMMFPIYRDARVSVVFGDALYGERATLQTVRAQMAGLLRRASL